MIKNRPVYYKLDSRKAPITPDLLLESRSSFSAGDVSTDTSSSDKTKPESPKAKSDDSAILRKSSKLINMTNTDPTVLTFRGKHFLDLIEFDENEKIVCEIRKHPFGLFVIYLMGGAISVILLAALVLVPYALGSVSSQDLGLDISRITPILAVVGLLLTFASLVATAITGYLYQNNVVLATNEKIAQQIYRTLFDKKISQLSIGDIQDVTVSQRGVFAKLFNYGTLIIETAGEQNNYVFNYSTNPYECSKLIVSAHEASIARYGN